MEWHYAAGSERKGPITEEELLHLAQAGVVTAETLIWRPGMADWKPFREAGPAAPPPLPESVPMRFCSGCGKQFPAAELVTTAGSALCAACRTSWPAQAAPVYSQPLTGPVRYAGFWIRFVAWCLDAIIIGAVQSVLFVTLFGGTILNIVRDAISGQAGPEMAFDILPVALAARFGSFVLALAYFAWCWVQYGATPGKMAFGLKVINPDGSPISPGQAIGRYLGTILSGIILGIGFIMAGFDDQKRALHDRLASTRVIHTR